jgi:hypothetical protein
MKLYIKNHGVPGAWKEPHRLKRMATNSLGSKRFQLRGLRNYASYFAAIAYSDLGNLGRIGATRF